MTLHFLFSTQSQLPHPEGSRSPRRGARGRRWGLGCGLGASQRTRLSKANEHAADGPRGCEPGNVIATLISTWADTGSFDSASVFALRSSRCAHQPAKNCGAESSSTPHDNHTRRCEQRLYRKADRKCPPYTRATPSPDPAWHWRPSESRRCWRRSPDCPGCRISRRSRSSSCGWRS